VDESKSSFVCHDFLRAVHFHLVDVSFVVYTTNHGFQVHDSEVFLYVVKFTL